MKTTKLTENYISEIEILSINREEFFNFINLLKGKSKVIYSKENLEQIRNEQLFFSKDEWRDKIHLYATALNEPPHLFFEKQNKGYSTDENGNIVKEIPFTFENILPIPQSLINEEQIQKFKRENYGATKILFSEMTHCDEFGNEDLKEYYVKYNLISDKVPLFFLTFIKKRYKSLDFTVKYRKLSDEEYKINTIIF
jgi:hypothetical protein